MISRIRIDLFGRSAADIEAQAEWFYNFLRGQGNVSAGAYISGTGTIHAPNVGGSSGFGQAFLGVDRGDVVIERDVAEPLDLDCAYKGRVLFYPNIATA